MAVRRMRNPLVVKKSVDQSFVLRFVDASGQLIDCTGFQFKTPVKYEAKGDAIFTLTTENGGFTISDGVPEIHFSAENLDLINVGCNNLDFPFTNVFIDVEYNDGSGWKPYLLAMVRVMEGLYD